MGRVFEVHTIEIVERIYTVEFHGGDRNTDDLKDVAEELVSTGEIPKFHEVNAEIDTVQSVKEVV